MSVWYTIFSTIVMRSLEASLVVLVIFVVRALTKKLPKRWHYILWICVLVRLVCPLSLPFEEGLLNQVQWGVDTVAVDAPKITPERKSTEEIQQSVTTKKTLGTSSIEQRDINLFGRAASCPLWICPLWMIGMGLLGLYFLITQIRFRRKIRFATRLHDRCYECEEIKSPFVYGLFRPRIYMPYRLEKSSQELIEKHENYHIKHFDNWVKFIASLCLVVFWFQPILWIAYGYMVRDMEMRCDQEVLKKAELSERRKYSEVLLSFAINRRIPIASPVAFGETSVNKRIGHVLKKQNYSFKATILGILVVVIVGIFCLTDTVEGKDQIPKPVLHKDIVTEMAETDIKDVKDRKNVDNLVKIIEKRYGQMPNYQMSTQTKGLIFSCDKMPDTKLQEIMSLYCMILINNAEEITFVDHSGNAQTYTHRTIKSRFGIDVKNGRKSKKELIVDMDMTFELMLTTYERSQSDNAIYEESGLKGYRFKYEGTEPLLEQIYKDMLGGKFGILNDFDEEEDIFATINHHRVNMSIKIPSVFIDQVKETSQQVEVTIDAIEMVGLVNGSYVSPFAGGESRYSLVYKKASGKYILDEAKTLDENSRNISKLRKTLRENLQTFIHQNGLSISIYKEKGENAFSLVP